jgi:hypothetical protein
MKCTPVRYTENEIHPPFWFMKQKQVIPFNGALIKSKDITKGNYIEITNTFILSNFDTNPIFTFRNRFS